MLSPRLTIARPLRLSNTKASNQVPLWYPAPRRTRTRCYTTNGTSIHTHTSSNPSAHPIHARSFHASAKFASPSTDTYSDEASVPKYYKERKSRKDEDVMEHLSDSAFSDEIAASTRRMAAKIPLQFFTDQGELIHPSGYIPPSPGDAPRRRDRQQDLAKQTAAVAERVLEEDFEDVEAALKTYKGKVPFEFQHEDGSTSHPSGFVPPTPAHMFGSYQPPSNPTNATSVNPKPYGNPKSQETDPRPQDKGDKAKQLSDIDQRKQEESNLMKELVSGVLERGVSASTEPKQEKVPKTVKESDGNKETAQYPAGFAPESIGKRS